MRNSILIRVSRGLGKRQNGGHPASPFQNREFRDEMDKAGAISVAIFRCRWPDEPAKKPMRLVTDNRDFARFGFVGWPKFDAHGTYIGPLPRSCGHKHAPIIGVYEGGGFKTADSAAFS